MKAAEARARTSMTEKLTLWVPGAPMVKRRPLGLGLTRQGRPHYIKRDPTGWEEEVTGAWLKQHGRTLLEGPLAVTCDFYIRGVQVTIEPFDGDDWRLGRGDVDNMTKAILDSLNGIAFRDDRQVVRLSVAKRKGVEHGRKE